MGLMFILQGSVVVRGRVAFAGKDVPVFGSLGVGAAFGMDAKKAQTRVIVRGGKCGWHHPTPSCVPKGKEIGTGGAVGMKVGSERSVYEIGGARRG